MALDKLALLLRFFGWVVIAAGIVIVRRLVILHMPWNLDVVIVMADVGLASVLFLCGWFVHGLFELSSRPESAIHPM